MSILRAMIATGEGAVGLVVLGCFSFAALAAPLIFPGDPLAIAGPALVPPFSDPAHLLGTDRLGRDVLVELVYGARTTLLVAIASAATALVIGTVVGTLAAFFGGLVDEVLMRITEAFQTVPAFLLSLALISVAGPTVPTIVLAIALGPGRSRRGLRVPRSCRCGSATLLPRRASSACGRWRSRCARSCRMR
jgi:peptide/nickel transport system permease protein